MSGDTISSYLPTVRVVYILHCAHSTSERAPGISNIRLVARSDIQVLPVPQSFLRKRHVGVGKQHLPLAHSIQAQASR